MRTRRVRLCGATKRSADTAATAPGDFRSISPARARPIKAGRSWLSAAKGSRGSQVSPIITSPVVHRLRRFKIRAATNAEALRQARDARKRTEAGATPGAGALTLGT